MGKGATINEGGYGARPYAPTRRLTRTNPPEPVRGLEDIVREARQSLRHRKPRPSGRRVDTPRKRVEPRSPRRKRCEYGVEPKYEGMWKGFRVLRVFHGGKAFLIEGWPTPILADARVNLPPEPYHPTYGPAARKEARELMAEAKRERINLGWSTKKNLCKVAKGECPLSYSVWRSACNYIQHVRWEREREQDLRERPFHFQIIPGQGVQIACR